jgi:Flp pilus assembly protein TadB
MTAVSSVVAVAAAVAAVVLVVPGVPTPASSRRALTVEPRGAADPGARRELPLLRLAAAASVGAGALVLVGGAFGAAAAATATAVCWWATGRMEPPAVRRRRERLAATVPHAVDLLAACLAAGLPPDAAVEQVTAAMDPPLADELAAVSSRLRLGVDPAAAWRDLSGHPQLGALGRTVSRALVSGAPVSEAMQRLAEDLRRSARADVESKARAVGVKVAVPLGVCLLPAFVLVGVVPLVAGAVSVLTGH